MSTAAPPARPSTRRARGESPPSPPFVFSLLCKLKFARRDPRPDNAPIRAPPPRTGAPRFVLVPVAPLLARARSQPCWGSSTAGSCAIAYPSDLLRSVAGPAPVVGLPPTANACAPAPAVAATLPDVGLFRSVQGQHRVHDPRRTAAQQPGSPPGRPPGRIFQGALAACSCRDDRAGALRAAAEALT